jgi:hypothetical protein
MNMLRRITTKLDKEKLTDIALILVIIILSVVYKVSKSTI